MVEISDTGLRAYDLTWLQHEPKLSVNVVNRALLRVFPFFWYWTLGRLAHENDVCIFDFLQPILIGSCTVRAEEAGTDLRQRLRWAARNQNGKVTARLDELGGVSREAEWFGELIAFTLSGAGNVFLATNAESALSIGALSYRRLSAEVTQDAFFVELMNDRRAVENGLDLSDLPLFRDVNEFTLFWEKLVSEVNSKNNWQPGDWQFWVEWYEQMLDPVTNPPNWELLEQIALIEPKVWDAGPKDVSAAIADIEERLSLRDEAKSWQVRAETLEAEIAALKMRSHNQPPELVEEVVALEAPIADLKQSLTTVAEELAKPEPEKSALLRCGEVIRDATLAIVKYCASVANDVIRSASKPFGAAGGTFLADKAFNDGRLVDYATKLLNFAAGL